MNVILFCGIQASGKSTFYKNYFFNTHVRISLDLLKTRHREKVFIKSCIDTEQSFVIDNTNPSKEDRKRYIELLKDINCEISGYYFQSRIEDSLFRNNQRAGKEKIPEVGIKATRNKLEIPSYDEGFDKLYYVEIINNQFIIKEWEDEV